MRKHLPSRGNEYCVATHEYCVQWSWKTMRDIFFHVTTLWRLSHTFIMCFTSTLAVWSHPHILHVHPHTWLSANIISINPSFYHCHNFHPLHHHQTRLSRRPQNHRLLFHECVKNCVSASDPYVVIAMPTNPPLYALSCIHRLEGRCIQWLPAHLLRWVLRKW